jgi:hypothetical protein
LSGDGRADLVVANFETEHTVSVLINRGDGSFQAAVAYTTGNDPVSVAIGDLNGDRKPDLAVANDAGDSVSVLTNLGGGKFSAKRDYQTGHIPLSVAIGDLDGDRKPDLAVANNDDASVSVLANRGDGSFQVRHDYETGSGPWSVAIGDLNGDRKTDLATANSNISIGSGQTVSVLINSTGRCGVPDVTRADLSYARRALARANCRVGTIRRAYSKVVAKGLVISERPRSGTLLRTGSKVNLVVSRGRKQ